ncbi:MAG: DEAD/DEAH box helicase, partial [Deltaproteobacteria bacterium]|nr:DEAD/DEAH box helicase [Deltaproteobacteria bacterium]
RSQLQALPQVVIGTPGRLLDHLRAGALKLDQLKTIALDEADEMLDMNFEEELDGILGYAPDARRTHLVSATFPREVVRLADRLQQDAVSVQGTVLGQANADIEHVVMIQRGGQRAPSLPPRQDLAVRTHAGRDRATCGGTVRSGARGTCPQRRDDSARANRHLQPVS